VTTGRPAAGVEVVGARRRATCARASLATGPSARTDSAVATRGQREGAATMRGLVRAPHEAVTSMEVIDRDLDLVDDVHAEET